MGLVWNLSAFTRETFEHNWPGADGSGVLGASSYLIGSDEAYMYLLSTPRTCSSWRRIWTAAWPTSP
jgi:hypothetical protein